MDDSSKISCQTFMSKFPEGLISRTNPKNAVCGNCSAGDLAICASLDDKMFAELNRIRVEKIISTNEVLFEEGSERKFVYTLREGMLRLFTSLPDGRRQISVFLIPGDFLGLIDDRCHTQTVEAVVASRLCCFRKDALSEVMEKYPEIYHRLLYMMRESLRYAWENQFLLGRMTPLEKVARFLVICIRQARKTGFPDNPVHFAMNRRDIADYLGLTVETVSRSFSRLKAQGIIRFIETNLVYIINISALCFAASMGDEYN